MDTFTRKIPLFPLCFLLLMLCCLGEADPVRGIEPVGTDRRDQAANASLYTSKNEDFTGALRHSYNSEKNSELRQAIPPGCFKDGKNRCFQQPATALLGYLKLLGRRVERASKASIDYTDKNLVDKLKQLGCLSVARIDTKEIRATVGLFDHGLVSRVRLDVGALQNFADKCEGKLLPLAYHQHELSKGIRPTGQLNSEGACDAPNTGGHHDPGLACGSTGGSLCSKLAVPPSSALEGTAAHTGEYNCTPETYALRPFACHAGDFTGKLGPGIDISPDPNMIDLRLAGLDWHADNPCVASESHHSLVMHCHSTNFRLACGSFQRVETAGNQLPELLAEIVRTAEYAMPYVMDEGGLLASLILAREAEIRVALLEKAAGIDSPSAHL